MRTTRASRPLLATLLAAAPFAGAPVAGQSTGPSTGQAAGQEVEPRWTPWVGCWQPVASEDRPATDDLLCIRPAGAGVEVVEVVDGESGPAQLLVADGRPRDVAVEGCEGWRSVEFSLDGQRLFTRAEQACAGDERRPSTGVIAMVSPREWIDVQATTVDGEALTWVRRYRAARAERAEAAGFDDLARARRTVSARALRAAAAPDVDDVVEASGAIDPEAVRSWVAELNDPFDLDANRLVRLADAGVPESVIDVMVAVSYPERFALERDGAVEELDPRATRPRGYARGGTGRRGVVIGARVWDPFYWRPFGYGYGYSSYGYGYPYGYVYDPGVVIVVPRRDDADARVVRGRGYTRGGSSRSDEGGSTARPSRPPRRNDQPSAGGSSGSGGPSTPSAPSSGGGSGGRQAKPR